MPEFARNDGKWEYAGDGPDGPIYYSKKRKRTSAGIVYRQRRDTMGWEPTEEKADEKMELLKIRKPTIADGE